MNKLFAIFFMVCTTASQGAVVTNVGPTGSAWLQAYAYVMTNKGLTQTLCQKNQPLLKQNCLSEPLTIESKKILAELRYGDALNRDILLAVSDEISVEMKTLREEFSQLSQDTVSYEGLKSQIQRKEELLADYQDKIQVYDHFMEMLEHGDVLFDATMLKKEFSDTSMQTYKPYLMRLYVIFRAEREHRKQTAELAAQKRLDEQKKQMELSTGKFWFCEGTCRYQYSYKWSLTADDEPFEETGKDMTTVRCSGRGETADKIKVSCVEECQNRSQGYARTGGKILGALICK